ncbi:MFS transporter [Noviherbaspirillum sedimenti]|uniref:MFS transporter n=1 Tax=Noviherbaspirillum sedimenti TaxID=2320865 RepID=A0A3A3G2B8_9BURK|nr:MFS transporter [Noviherbaspirillum sedimenti]RJG02607.1 MFS transporter [Noviherbaspirillum sedimenti]
MQTDYALSPTNDDAKKAEAPQHRKVAMASLIGTAVEWYDFYIYGTCAALIFPKLFFPSVDPTLGVIAAFATYAVGFIARPVGAAVFGHYGDRVGRKKILMLSLLMMGGSTVAIGLLPTYETAGVWAAVLLCLMRLLQGFAVGGEWGSAVVMAVEHAPKNKRGLFGSMPQVGVPLGLLASTAVFSLVSSNMTDEALYSWGWRIPFLLSIVMIVIGMFVRSELHESPAFKEMVEQKEVAKNPAIEVVREQWKTLLVTIGMKMLQNAVFYIYSVFMLSYIVKELHMPRSVGLNAIIIASIVGIFTIPAWSYLSDKIGRKPVYMFGCIASVLFIFPFFYLVQTKSVVLITIAIVIGLNVLHDAMYGPQAVYYSELFGTKVRLSGANIGYAIGAVLSGGIAPMVAAALIASNKGSTDGVAWYLVGLGVISVIATLFARETFKEHIGGAKEKSPRRAVTR